MSEIAIFRQLAEHKCLPAVLIDFPQDRVVFVTAESEAPTQLDRSGIPEARLPDEFAIQEQVKCAVTGFDYFENRVGVLV
jgi:hypothetical protein